MFPKLETIKTSLETWVCHFKHTGETLTVEMDWHLKQISTFLLKTTTHHRLQMCKVSEKKNAVSDSVWLSDFSFSPASSSFLSGVLRGYRGAAVHHLPQGSSVLQTVFLSGATCRYGKEKQTTWQRVYVCVGGGEGEGEGRTKKTPWCWLLWGFSL